MKVAAAAMFLGLAGTPALAHRLDEYLQGTLLSIEKDRVQAQMTLTPGVAVFPLLLAEFDTDGNGFISETEKRAYAERVLRDLRLGIDGVRLMPRLLSVQFPAVEEMKEGRGEIRIEFGADLPGGGRERRIALENHHENRIAAYQVNCLVPRDRNIRVLAQHRNYDQSNYELDYVQSEIAQPTAWKAWWSGDLGLLSAMALFLITRFTVAWRGNHAR